MESISLVLTLGIIFAISIFRPGLTGALLLLMYPLEQIFQVVSQGLLPNIFLNITIGIVTIISLFNKFFKHENIFRGYISLAFVLVIILYSYSAISLVWSPGQSIGLELVPTRIPFFVLYVILGPLLITTEKDLYSLIWWMGILTLGSCILVLISPEFQSQWGRLGLVVGGKLRTNPLALGELGGIAVIIGGVYRFPVYGIFNFAFRTLLVVLGGMVAIKAGSRGQLFGALFVVVCCLPISAKIKNIRSFISIIIILIFVSIITKFLLDNLLEGGDAKRFTIDEILYGSSSASERLNNILSLANMWISNPRAVITGLGSYAFASVGDKSIVYSHNITADMIFELGLPGISIYITLIIITISNLRFLFKFTNTFPMQRMQVGFMIALIFFQFILMNKQGDLWNGVVIFYLALTMSRCASRTLDGNFWGMQNIEHNDFNEIMPSNNETIINDTDTRLQ